MRTIPLSNSPLVAVVDDADYESVAGLPWRAHVCPRATYAIRNCQENGRNISIYMHRQLLGAVEGEEVDHEDRDGLNNRRENMRLMTKAQNLHRSRPRIGSKSGLKGVWWSKQKQKWMAAIMPASGRLSLGSYNNKHLAAFAYNVAAAALYGEFAYLNPIPPEIPCDQLNIIEARTFAILNGKRFVNQHV